MPARDKAKQRQKQLRDSSKRHGSTSQNRFQVLEGLGTVIVVAGWIAGAVGVIVFLIGLNEMGGYDQSEAYGYFLIGFGTAVGGLITVAVGQISQCFVAIEKNTRRAAQAVDGAEMVRVGVIDEPANADETPRRTEETASTRPDDAADVSSEREAALRDRYGVDSSGKRVKRESETWECKCGAVNYDDMTKCPECGRSRDAER